MKLITPISSVVNLLDFCNQIMFSMLVLYFDRGGDTPLTPHEQELVKKRNEEHRARTREAERLATEREEKIKQELAVTTDKNSAACPHCGGRQNDVVDKSNNIEDVKHCGKIAVICKGETCGKRFWLHLGIKDGPYPCTKCVNGKLGVKVDFGDGPPPVVPQDCIFCSGRGKTA